MKNTKAKEKARSKPAPRKSRTTLLSDEQLRKVAGGIYSLGGGFYIFNEETRCGKSSCAATDDVCCP